MHTRSNLHTHSTYCDGQNTLAEMAAAAEQRGFVSLGFSGHAYMPWVAEFTMTPSSMALYRAEVGALREQYAGRMDIFCGVENDFAHLAETDGFDYVIGACHTVPSDSLGHPCDVDNTPEMLLDCIRMDYGGDALAMASAYYDGVAAYAAAGGYDICAHFDLLTKFNEKAPFLDETDAAYRRMALDALDAVIDAGVIIEINTGAIARGWRTAPYPAPFLLRHMHERHARVILSADAHRADMLTAGFDAAEELLRASGFTEQMQLTRAGFVPVSL